jgi:autotransporter-associated beta strand protein
MKKAAQLLLPALALLAATSAQAQTTVSSGYVQSVGAGTVTLNGGGLLANNGNVFTVTNNIVLGTNGGLFRAYDSVTGTFLGLNDKPEGTLVINGSVSGSGGATIQDGGQIRFNGSNSYTGNTRFEATGAGTPAVYIGNVNAFSGSTVVIDGFQSLNFSVAGTNTYNFGGLSAGRNLGLGANTLSVGANNENNHYYGVLSGTGGFVKVGSGTQTLSGPNSFTGGTIINDGTLALGPVGNNNR